jgi:hypothetical protein
MPTPFSKARVALLPALAAAALAACSSAPHPKFQQELFDNGATPFSHNFSVTSADACEAARRALLSQGYMTTMTRNDTVDATKNYQPTSDTHVSVDFHVVCTPGDDAADSSIVYANAVQNGYALKKSDTSASVGLSVFGSLSLPIRSNSDAMVKISSETVQSANFYNRFFDFVDHYLHIVRTAPVPVAPIGSNELPPLPLSGMPTTASASAPASAPPAGKNQGGATQPAP